MPGKDDAFYIQRVLDGDTSSFTPLVEHFKDMVFTVCLRILRQREDAEDVAQKAFLKAYRSLHTFEGKSKFSTWLYTIAYRCAISQAVIQRQDFPEMEVQEPVDPFAFPQVEHLHRDEIRYYVLQAIDRLSEIDSLVISLFYLEELSIQEIMSITDLQESNVKVRLHRARKLLKEHLEQLLQQEINTFLL